ncbi:oligosaccharide flippase family protein [Bradyrhizobium sp. ORS 86]|uniref:oligosaccharide flippase family protein n=1 Tax=Bradyrhizobium sp. ORS 86 TaxID=1685970 RepID=UPI00388EB2F8
MRLRQAILSSAVQQNATLLLFFATGVVIAHLLTPRQAGSYSIAIAAAGTVADLKDTALGSYVVSSPKLDNSLLSAAFGLSLTIAACLTIGLFGLSFALTAFYGDEALGHSLRILAFAQLCPAVAFPATMRLMRAMRFGALLIVGLVAASGQSAVSITLAALGYGADALAWGYFASAVMTAVMTIAYKLDALRLAPTLAGSRRLLAFGGWTSATLLVGSATLSGPELMIGRAVGLANAALFSRAQNLVSFVRNGLVLGMTKPLLPNLGERESRGVDLAPIYGSFVETMTGLAWPVYALLAIWAEPLVRTIYGEAWRATGAMMIPIAIAHAVTLTAGPYYDILIVRRRQRLLFACEAAVCVFTIMMLGIGLTLGIEAAIWTLPISGLFFAACYLAVLRSVVGYDPGRLFKAWAKSLAATLVVVPVPLVLRHVLTQGPTEILFGFAASGAISVATWVVALTLVRHELSVHVRGLIEDLSRSLGISAYPRFLPQPSETDRR